MRRSTHVLLTAAAVVGFIGASTAPAALASTGGSTVNSAVATARQATAQFHDVNAALAAGYVRVSDCTELPGVGAMGYHYMNPAYASDGQIVAGKPDLLLYAPAADGGLKLVGVEYFRPDADQDLSTDNDRPSFYGVPFDGPMLGHSEGMPIHYDLHVWAWQANPAGTFAEWNPNVHC